MPLGRGSRLGSYEIQSALGAGGMGEVYRARDTRLKRDVAVKILPESFASDPDRLARFQREAEALASLSHPNIAGIYGLEETDGVRAIVMELVEGETLADRIAGGPIPLDEALPIARQIAEALEAAHEQGVIHRDLKPANIKVTPDGRVKVLDFGLAKLHEPGLGIRDSGFDNSKGALSRSPTITSPALVTGVGVLLGTAAYMAPEQAKGKPADKRSDIWAFGCVLYEMLTGTRPFDGEDVTDVLGAVVRLEPNWNLLPADVPAPIRTLLQRCLHKDRRRRIADISTALFVIDETKGLAVAPPAVPTVPRWRRLAIHSALAIVAAVTAGTAVWFLMRSAPPAVFRAHLVTTAPNALNIQGNDIDFAITPDGSRIIYRGANQLVVRAVDRLEPQVLSGLGVPREPFCSPDGQWIGYFDGASLLKKVAISGGPPVTIAKVDGTGPRGATWGTDGSIVFATQADSGLLRVSAAGGDPTVITTPRREAGEIDHRWPEFLPGGHAVLFTIFSAGVGGLDSAQVAVLDLATGKYNPIIQGGYHAHYVPTGHLVYGAGGTLRAVGFDLKRLQVIGPPVPVLESVLTAGSGAVQAAVAANGTLVYLPSLAALNVARSLVWVTRDGREENVPAPRRAYDSFQLSPDGSRAAMQIADDENDIWIWDFARRTLTRLTFGRQLDYDPLWTPDGGRIVFSRGSVAGVELVSRAADGTGSEDRLANGNMTATSFSPDGKQLIVWQLNDIGVLSMNSNMKVRPLVRTTSDEGHAYLSPDGRWLAYRSNESGEDQIYVQPFPQLSGGRWQVSPAGGVEPAWARNGRELFYIDGTGSLVTVPVQTQPTFAAGNPTKLFDAHYVGVSGTRRYDVTADGQRFLFIKGASDASGGSASSSLVVVQHWTEELKRLLPTN